MRDPDCLFCKIVAGELPATIIAEDEHTISFMDINPATRGHALVIPRGHAEDLLSIDSGDLREVIVAAQRLAGRAKERLGAAGVNLINSCGGGRVADRLPLPRARHPALRGRPVAPALAAAPRRSAGDRRRRRGAEPMSAAPPAAPGVRVERDGVLAVMVIDHPPLNLFTRELIDDLIAAVDELEHGDARGLLVRAEGRVVSGGVDVHLFDGLSVPAAAALWQLLLATIHRVEDLPMPTVFAAHGLCLTAAFELSLACDLLLASSSARFGLVERVVGLTPAMGGTQRLVERAGPARARELVMTGEPYDAATLHGWNVVNRVLPDEGFGKASLAFARGLAEGPTRAHVATKQIVRAALLGGGARGADARVPDIAGGLFDTEDLKGAVRSFLEHGPGHATFEGR